MHEPKAPHEMLDAIRFLAKRTRDRVTNCEPFLDEAIKDAERLALLFQILDVWLEAGGELPGCWKRAVNWPAVRV